VLPACCVCKECVCWPCTISHDVSLFYFLSSIPSRALRHMISILAGQRGCVRARSSAAQVRRRSDQERAILSRQDHPANRRARRALQAKSRDFFIQPKFKSSARALVCSVAEVRHRSDQERARLSRQARQQLASNSSRARTPRSPSQVTGFFSSNPSSSPAHSLPRLCHRIHFCL